MLATYLEQEGVVSQLLNVMETDVNAANDRGNTALIIAASLGYGWIVEQLRQVVGIDFDATNDRGDTAQIRATKKGHFAIAQVLKLGSMPFGLSAAT